MLLFRQRQQNHQRIGMVDYGNRRHTAKSYTCLQVWVFVMFRLNHENWKYKTKQIKVIQVHKKFCLNKIFAQTNFESKNIFGFKRMDKKISSQVGGLVVRWLRKAETKAEWLFCGHVGAGGTRQVWMQETAFYKAACFLSNSDISSANLKWSGEFAWTISHISIHSLVIYDLFNLISL